MCAAETYVHRRLACGAELAALPLPGRRTAAFDIRICSGLVDEPADRLGLAGVVNETIDKGTSRFTAQQLTDAFDAIGAQTSSRVGRESALYRCACLPEYVEAALELYAEMLCRPTFPDEFCRVAVELGKQELTALEDDPGELARRLIGPHAYGPLLGRHELGTAQCLSAIGRNDAADFWRRTYSAERMQIAVGGSVDVDRFCRRVDELFEGFGGGGASGGNGSGGGQAIGHRPEFSPGVRHQHKELEQQHMLICWPGLSLTHDDNPIEQLVLAMLGDGMSSRLFVEVREKQGLVYWVGAWDEHPRGSGMIFLGASTTPARCDQTFRTLLREVDRLGEDVTDEELTRAKTGIVAKSQTHGDITRARVGELSGDLFHRGRPVPVEEKNRLIEAVTLDDVRRYLRDNRRERLCVQTLGTRPLEGSAT